MSNSLGVLGVGVLISYGVRGINTIKGAQKDLQNMFFTVENGVKKMTDLGRAIVQVTAAMAAMKVGSAMVDFAVDSIQAYADYEEKMLDLTGLLGRSRDEMEVFTAAARDMASEYAYSTGEVAEAMWWLTSAGLGEEKVLAALEPTLRYATIGHMDLGEAAMDFSKILMAFNVPAEDYEETLDIMTKGMAMYSITMEDYGHAFGTFGMMAKSSGQDLEEMIALWGTFTTLGLSPSRAGMMVKMLLTSLYGASEESREIRRGLGVEIIDPITGQFRSLLDVIDDMNAALENPANSEFLASIVAMGDESLESIALSSEGALYALATIFGRRAIAGAMSLQDYQIADDPRFAGMEGGDVLRQQENLMLQAASEGFTDNYIEQIQTGINYSLENIKTTFQTIKEMIGEDIFGTGLGSILDDVNTYLGTIGDFLDANPQLSKAIGWALILGGSILAVAGLAILIALVISVAGGILVIVLKIIAIVLLVGAALAGLVFLVVNFWDEIVAFFEPIIAWIWERIEPVITSIINYATAFWTSVKWIWEYILLPVLTIIGVIISVVLAGVSVIVGIILAIFRWIWSIIEVVLAFFNFLFTGDLVELQATLNRIFESLIEDIIGIGDFFVVEIGGALGEVINQLFAAVWDSEVGKALFHPWDLLGGNNNQGQPVVPPAGGQAASLGVSSLHVQPARFASGIRRVVSDGFYGLHEGERVSPPHSKFLSNEASGTENKFTFGDIRITLQGSGNNEEDARRIARLVKEQIEAEMARTYRSK